MQPANDPPTQRPRLNVGAQVRHWRMSRGMTLAGVAARSGLNVGYLSQIENDKASPSLDTLAQLAQALDVPAAWFLMSETPPPRVVRATERPTVSSDLGRLEHVDGRTSRDISFLEVSGPPGGRVGAHAHPGDEHHLVLRGRWRLRQGEHEVELGPGDYLGWDGAVPHDGEAIGEEHAAMLIIRVRPRD